MLQNSRFGKFLERTLELEGALGTDGGFTNDPSDPGQATQWGLSSKFNPDVAPQIQKGELSLPDAMKIHYNKYYRSLPNIDVIDEDLAWVIFDSNFHGGLDAKLVIKTLQFVMNTIDGRKLRLDGNYGHNTAAAAANISSSAKASFFEILESLAPKFGRIVAERVLAYQRKKGIPTYDYAKGFSNRILDRVKIA